MERDAIINDMMETMMEAHMKELFETDEVYQEKNRMLTEEAETISALVREFVPEKADHFEDYNQLRSEITFMELRKVYLSGITDGMDLMKWVESRK